MFGTSGIRGEFGTDVTAALAVDVGRALASTGRSRVVVGRDPRETGAPLVDALAAGLRECGADVADLGEVPTPTVARAVGWLDADAGVAVTASHNPPEDNGIKLWDADGAAFTSGDQTAVVERVERDDYESVGWRDVGDRWTEPDARRRHVDAVVDAVDVDGRPEVVVDVGHGSGRLTTDALRRLGCEVTALHARPDGSFPARPSEPTADHCEALCEVVADGDADFGVAHDGDADRMLAVTGDGAFVSGDVLLALFARREASPGEQVAVPIDTSMAVREALAGVGATVTFTRVGDGFVADRASDDGVAFGGEPSGAWIWPALSLCPDGTLAAAKLAALVADRGPLSDLVAGVPSVPIRRENVPAADNDAVVERVRSRIADRYENVTNVDGVRVDHDDGWFLVRASGTQPLVRITAQADDDARMTSLFDTASELVEAAIDDLDAGVKR
ncbi:phosphoglucosamine mutase [Halobacterium jilantaiense]|uniref:Phosphoglucosamine mutase n=1 Tax=Halobacterium jilantaiense TaxID=355548 RepID=A0A1I0MRG3_9EURY|nr:phosphoglucosamine mutase [Halobacterium jilantaiense]SEV90814.1 phosphoglucosamine mutase [Halobacterium jilantaiense]